MKTKNLFSGLIQKGSNYGSETHDLTSVVSVISLGPIHSKFLTLIQKY